MPPINFSINENATVQYIIEQSQAASLQVGQQYCIVTFDLAVAKKAYSFGLQKLHCEDGRFSYNMIDLWCLGEKDKRERTV